MYEVSSTWQSIESNFGHSIKLVFNQNSIEWTMSMEFMFKTGICFAEVSHQGRIYTLYSDMDEGYQQIS